MRSRLLVLPIVAVLSSCTSIVAQSRLYGPAQPPRELGCQLQMVRGPASTPAFAIGEATCTPESEGDAEACQDQIRDRLCEMGADAIAPQGSRRDGTLVAVGLKFGQGGGPQQQAWT
ncbi:MAG: hypothetical protein HYY06_15585, partial [Deltaproteobacteria bacterium]|nr:hypothetical protein [Deltaproteobacteria bacterium]